MPSVSGVKPLKVPERHVAAFEALLSMQEDDFGHLLSVLEAAPPTDAPDKLAESIQEATALRVSDARSLLEAVMELAALKQRSLSSSGHMAARVAASSQFTDGDYKSDAFIERTRQLLSSGTVRLHSKVLSIGSEYERLFVNCQILTDLRPIFDDEIAERPESEAVLLRHTLSLHYVGSDGKHDNFYVVLDEGDLIALNQVIHRALSKAESLRKKLYQSDFIYVSSEE